MKYLLSILLFVTISAKAQKTQASSTINQQIYIQVDSFRTDLKLLIIKPDKIESIEVLKGEHALSKFGNKAKDGAIIIKTKAGVKLLQLQNILNKYNIATAERTLRVCINQTIVKNTDLLLIEESEITAVEITTEHNWLNVEDENSNERFINIKIVSDFSK